MDLKARLCVELDGSVTAELLVASYRGEMTMWSSNFRATLAEPTLPILQANHDMICARNALEDQLKQVKVLLGDTIRIRTFKVVRAYEEIFDGPVEAPL